MSRYPRPRVAAHAALWTRDRRVQMFRRQLNYRDWPNRPPVENGIDVAIAIDLVYQAFQGKYDALVLFSGDTDLLPALEMVVRLRLGHVEVACWQACQPLRLPGTKLPYCHFLTEQDWNASIDDWKGRVL